jgi:methionyl-tRNA formyltransferase
MKFCMILTNNNRSKAYIQNLVKEDLIPSKVVYMFKKGSVLAEHTDNDSHIFDNTSQNFISKCPVSGMVFNEKESIPQTLNKYKIPYDSEESDDPNDKCVLDSVKKLPHQICVYSGPGGKILKPHFFKIGKTFIHAHPGKLPSFRGSTTIYYSLLISRSIYVSIIELNENLDEGDICLTDEYYFKPGASIDFIVDPCVRAKSLINYFKNKKRHKPQDQTGDTFYIIHPVLKHLSILKNNVF